jgi:hypothetical protein
MPPLPDAIRLVLAPCAPLLSPRQASRLLWGRLVTSLLPPGTPRVLGADDTGARRRGRPITATGCDRDAGRAPQTHVLRGGGVTWVVRLRLVPVPWSRRVWALPLLPALGRPAEQATRRRHKTSVDWVRPMMPPGRRGRPGRPLVLGVDGGLAAGSWARAGGTPQGAMVSRVRWEAALEHRPGTPSPSTRGRTPPKGRASAAGPPGQNALRHPGSP